jgi:succinate dehydrogenase / fumarate reductase, iron-sulfur subunit
MAEEGTIRVKVRRRPGDGVDTYEVEVEPGMSIFNVLDRIRNTLDPTLAFPMSCRIGKCDICLVKVDGQTKWTCTEPARDGMFLEALDRYEVLKDLVVDFERKAPLPATQGTRADPSRST